MITKSSQEEDLLWEELTKGAVVLTSRHGGTRAVVLYNDGTPPRHIRAAILRSLCKHRDVCSTLVGLGLIVHSPSV